ncbi:cadherin EGF LAG seven-pass G-type receptor 2-like [Pseudopipra pipra]|uniref:cadherin EGF LAG seven-pass G-type receptor 2-like n=1 Tax=Pseudopipra pipra TaxID=415032 RepID=UPI003138662D
MFLSCVVLSKEVRRSLRLSCARRHHPPLATKATLTPPPRGLGGARGSPAVMSLCLCQAYSGDSTYVAGPLCPPPGGGSSGSLHSTARSGKSHHSYIPFVRREDSGLAGSPGPLPEPGGLFLDAQEQPEEHDTDSDSDLSLDDPSGSYGSTHSSDSDDEPPPGWDPLPGAPPAPPGPGAARMPPGCPYWPGEFVTTASESEGVAGTEGLRVQPAGGARGPPRGDPPRPNGEALPREPLLLPLPHPHKGILKKKCLPPISERGGSAQRPGPPPPPPAGTAASSGSDGGAPPAPRARQSLEEQLSGLTPIAMSIRAGTADEDSSGSESNETSI